MYEYLFFTKFNHAPCAVILTQKIMENQAYDEALEEVNEVEYSFFKLGENGWVYTGKGGAIEYIKTLKGYGKS